MDRLRRLARLALIACVVASAHAQAAADPLALVYRLGPVPSQGALRALDVTISFDLPGDGALAWVAPRGISARRPSAYVSAPDVRGATLARGADGTWIVRGRPGRHVTMHYRVRPAFGGADTGDGIYRGAWLRDGQFEALGNDLFAAPEGHDEAPLSFRWQAPADWQLATPLRTFGARATVRHLLQSSFVGAKGLATASRPIHGGVLSVSSVGAAMPLDALAEAMVPVVNGLRAFWGDAGGDFVVTVLAMPAKDKQLIGIGRDGGFMAVMAADTPPQKVAWLATHEYTHAWIPGRTGRMPDGAEEPSAYWFSEGFTVFYTDRIGLRDGRATLRDFQDSFNATAVGYDMSPVRRAPNSRIVDEFWTRPEVQWLPYARGAMFAYWLDARLRQRTAGRRTLDDVMRRMRDRFSADGGLGVRDNLVRSYAEMGGGDIADALARYIDRGEQIVLPDTLFGGCLTILREHKPGFGLVQSAQLATGLSPQRAQACRQRLGGAAGQ